MKKNEETCESVNESSGDAGLETELVSSKRDWGQVDRNPVDGNDELVEDHVDQHDVERRPKLNKFEIK